VHCLDDKGRVYKIRPRNGAGPEKNINRAEFKVLPSTAAVGTRDSPLPELHSFPQENDNDIEMSGDGSEMGSLIMVNIQPRNFDHPQPPAIPPNLLPEVTAQAETQQNCLADQLQKSVTSPVPLRRSSRATAGRHTNPFNLPQSFCRQIEDGVPQAFSQSTYTMYRSHT